MTQTTRSTFRWSIAASLLIACSGSPGAGPDAPPGGPEGQWTWHDVPGMVCGNGSPTGIAINPTTRSDKLVIAVEGGGACWEAAACYGILIPVTSSHLDGFTEETFQTIRAQYFDGHWAFSRDATSLFADATWAFVPYCTGDLHAGTQTTVYEALGQQATMHHVGANNMDAVLAYLAPRAPTEVFAIGVSAGGYGVQLNWDRIAAAFPGATTHIYADGAQTVRIEGSRWGAMKQRWAPRFPAGCADCADGMDRVGAHLRAAPPASGGRYALTASLQDQTLGLYFGLDAQALRSASLAIGDAMTGSHAAFMVDDASHTMFAAPNTKTEMVTLREWSEGWYSGTPAFTTVGP